MYDLFNLHGRSFHFWNTSILMKDRLLLKYHSQMHYRKVLFQQQEQMPVEVTCHCSLSVNCGFGETSSHFCEMFW